MKKLILLLSIVMLNFAQAKVYDFVAGNKIDLLEDPYVSNDLKIEWVKKAKHHIHIVSFFWDDSSFPVALSEELKKASERGVEVRVLTTTIPTRSTDIAGKGRKILTTDTNEALLSYLELNPGFVFSLTHNLHEKIFLVDGEKAIIGGRNISDSSIKGKDLEVLLRGPVVNQVQDHFKIINDFLIHWKINGKCPVLEDSSRNMECENKYLSRIFELSDKRYFPVQKEYENGEEARVLSHHVILDHYNQGSKRKNREDLKDDILDTVMNIKFTELKMYQYFMIPTKRFDNYLKKNLTQGKKIEVITNSLESGRFSSNKGYIYSLPLLREYLVNGMDIYQWQKNERFTYVHEKLLIFDKQRIVLGSHNFGVGSTAISNEIALDIKSPRLAEHLAEIFDAEKANPTETKETTLEQLSNESSEYRTLIKILHNKVISRLLKEIY